MLKPRSAIQISPGWNLSAMFVIFTIFLSDLFPPVGLEMYEIVPLGVIPTRHLRVGLDLYWLHTCEFDAAREGLYIWISVQSIVHLTVPFP